MTDKEMHKLSRRELLQLLLVQVRETEELKQLLAGREDQLTELCGNYEKLRKRLDQKDAKIHELRDTLHAERTTRRIELQEAGSIAEAALRLNGIFDIAQKAADQYLENIRMLNDRLASGEKYPAFRDETDAPDSGEAREDAALPEPERQMSPAEDGYGEEPERQMSPAEGGSGEERQEDSDPEGEDGFGPEGEDDFDLPENEEPGDFDLAEEDFPELSKDREVREEPEAGGLQYIRI